MMHRNRLGVCCAALTHLRLVFSSPPMALYIFSILDHLSVFIQSTVPRMCNVFHWVLSVEASSKTLAITVVAGSIEVLQKKKMNANVM